MSQDPSRCAQGDYRAEVDGLHEEVRRLRARVRFLRGALKEIDIKGSPDMDGNELAEKALRADSARARSIRSGKGEGR